MSQRVKVLMQCISWISKYELIVQYNLLDFKNTNSDHL